MSIRYGKWSFDYGVSPGADKTLEVNGHPVAGVIFDEGDEFPTVVIWDVNGDVLESHVLSEVFATPKQEAGR